jgi:hypothetical protein
MVFTFRNRLKIIIQQSMPATSNISNMGYLRINMTVILMILLFLILKMMRFLLANHSLIISVCTVFWFKYVVNENVPRTTELHVSKIFSMKYIFRLYFVYLTLLIMNWQMILNTERNKHFHHSFTCWFISLHTWQHLWWCDLFPAQVLQHS